MRGLITFPARVWYRLDDDSCVSRERKPGDMIRRMVLAELLNSDYHIRAEAHIKREVNEN